MNKVELKKILMRSVDEFVDECEPSPEDVERQARGLLLSQGRRTLKFEVLWNMLDTTRACFWSATKQVTSGKEVLYSFNAAEDLDVG